MRISIIGTGYVGLVSGACFSKLGLNVICVDNDVEKLNRLQHNIIDIYEPGLEELVRRGINSGKLSFSDDLPNAVNQSDIVFISVGTQGKQNGELDISQVLISSHEIAKAMVGYTLIVTKSTVPVGTGSEIEKIVKNIADKKLFDIVSNPEFLREGSAVYDFLNPERIVIGCKNEKVANLLAGLYKRINLGPVFQTSIETAELIKFASNSFLATKITFINEMSILCESVGADIRDLATALRFDKRIGDTYLSPGPGYGGSCLPKDTKALFETARNHDVQLPLINSVIQANDDRVIQLSQRVINSFENSKGIRIGVLGTTFKANTDDIRHSPSIYLILRLMRAGFKINTYDPKGNINTLKSLPEAQVCENAYEAGINCQAIIIMTEWEAFRDLDFDKLGKLMSKKLIFDFRNLLDEKKLLKLGFTYKGVGFKTPEGIKN